MSTIHISNDKENRICLDTIKEIYCCKITPSVILAIVLEEVLQLEFQINKTYSKSITFLHVRKQVLKLVTLIKN